MQSKAQTMSPLGSWLCSSMCLCRSFACGVRRGAGYQGSTKKSKVRRRWVPQPLSSRPRVACWHPERRIWNKLMHMANGDTATGPHDAAANRAQVQQGGSAGTDRTARSRSRRSRCNKSDAPPGIPGHAAPIPKAATVAMRQAVAACAVGAARARGEGEPGFSVAGALQRRLHI